MTAQQARPGGKFLSLDRSHQTPRAINEEAQRGRTTQPATAPRFPLRDFLSDASMLALMRFMTRRGPQRAVAA